MYDEKAIDHNTKIAEVIWTIIIQDRNEQTAEVSKEIQQKQNILKCETICEKAESIIRSTIREGTRRRI